MIHNIVGERKIAVNVRLIVQNQEFVFATDFLINNLYYVSTFNVHILWLSRKIGN